MFTDNLENFFNFTCNDTMSGKYAMHWFPFIKSILMHKNVNLHCDHLEGAILKLNDLLVVGGTECLKELSYNFQ